MTIKISGHTTPLAVLGHPIGHTLSPVMHNAAIDALGMDAIYLAFDVAPERLMPVLDAMRDMGFAGVNLTVPLKEVAFKNLAKLDESAARLGAVNTVALNADPPTGYNTDGIGFLEAQREAFGSPVEGLSVLVLGTGGAGRAVAITCATAGARAVALSDLEPARSEAVRAEIGKLGAECDTQIVQAEPDTWLEAARAADLVIQATPVGLKRTDRSILPPDAFRKGQRVFDLVYMYPETAFMKTARQAGARTANGLGMLLHQGARALSIWTGAEPPVAVMRATLEQAVYKE